MSEKDCCEPLGLCLLIFDGLLFDRVFLGFVKMTSFAMIAMFKAYLLLICWYVWFTKLSPSSFKGLWSEEVEVPVELLFEGVSAEGFHLGTHYFPTKYHQADCHERLEVSASWHSLESSLPSTCIFNCWALFVVINNRLQHLFEEIDPLNFHCVSSKA